MMRSFCLFLALLLISSSAFAADIVLRVTVKDSPTQTEDIAGFLYVVPNDRTIPDPEWVDPEDGSEAPRIAKYTNKQWAEAYLAEKLEKLMSRGRTLMARNAINITAGEVTSG